MVPLTLLQLLSSTGLLAAAGNRFLTGLVLLGILVLRWAFIEILGNNDKR